MASYHNSCCNICKLVCHLSLPATVCVVILSAAGSVCMQIVYYDGQFDDSRLCVALACTAALAGAAVTNHTEATKFLKVHACLLLTPSHTASQMCFSTMHLTVAVLPCQWHYLKNGCVVVKKASQLLCFSNTSSVTKTLLVSVNTIMCVADAISCSLNACCNDNCRMRMATLLVLRSEMC